MPKKNYKVWTLNAAENLIKYIERPTDSEEMWLKQIEFELTNLQFNLELGKRSVKGKDITNIMPDDEYFVPIAVKSIGQFFDNPPAGSDTALLNNIKSYYINKGQKDYKFFWSDECGKIYDSAKMITPKYEGYYEFLLNNGTNHILIGYSQGGLVARYLAYLDEYVFKKNIIKGVITVSSPNFGSPLGNPDNQNDITKKIIEAVFMTFSFYNPNFSDLIAWSQNKLGFKDVIDVLNMTIKGTRSLTDISKESRENFLSLVITMKKWLGGLSDDINNAFYDLKISRLEENYSALNLVNKNDPINIYYGAILSADNDFERILESFIDDFFSPLIQIALKNILHNNKFEILDKSFIQNAGSITKIYKKEIMKEYTPAVSQKIQEIIDAYNNGLGEIESRSHDFIIPSVYQLLCKNMDLSKCFKPDKIFMGNYLNKYASHNSGKDLKFEGGLNNFKYIKQYVKKIMQLDNT